MADTNVAVVILAAGMGTRMRSELPKVLHPLAGHPLVRHALSAAEAVSPRRTVVVVGHGMDAVTAAVAPAETVVQEPQLGTGHAVMQARAALDGFEGTVLVLFGDTPLIRTETLTRMAAARQETARPTVVVLGFRPHDATGYGRLLLGPEGDLQGIVEARDASEAELAKPLCNGGVMAIDGGRLFGLLDRLGNDNAKGEFYLTDIVALARADGLACAVVEGAPDEVLGVDTRAKLAQAEAIMQGRLRAAAMAGGATLIDPETVYLSADTVIGTDCVIGPNVVFGPGVVVEAGATIKAFSHLEGARIASGAQIGPFARLRPGAEIGAEARIGNFVEVKAAVVEAGAKVNHLSYVGDARVGEGANVGAGTITCNYDGVNKSFTEIGAGAFIGSNTALVAPVSVGERAIVGAGSVISRDVAPDALALTRAPQEDHADGARRLRARYLAKKKAREREQKS